MIPLYRPPQFTQLNDGGWKLQLGVHAYSTKDGHDVWHLVNPKKCPVCGRPSLTPVCSSEKVRQTIEYSCLECGFTFVADYKGGWDTWHYDKNTGIHRERDTEEEDN
jgi:ferredoxin-like protein FixX